MAEEELRAGEEAAANGGEADFSSGHKTNVTGAVAATKGGKLKSLSIKTFGVIVAVIALVLLFVTPIYAIDAISTRLIEETDQQYTDAVENKAVVFQNALENGKIPEATWERLQQEGVEVGYMDGNTFIASRFGQTLIAANDLDGEITYKRCDNAGSCSPLSIKMDDGTVIPASQFYYEVNHNVKLYNAFTNATYGRAAYYYDEEAQRVFREIGTSRNNYGGDEDLETLMDKIMGTGHNFGIESHTWHYLPWWVLYDEFDPTSYDIDRWDVVPDPFNCSGTTGSQLFVTWRRPQVNGPFYDWGVDEKGNRYLIKGPYWTLDNIDETSDYGCVTTSSDSFIRTLAQSNMNNTDDFTQSNLNTVDTLKVSDTITKEKRSMLLYAGIAESFSRTKAGYGSTNGETNSILAAVATIGAATGGGADVNDVMNWLYETTTTVSYDEYGNAVYSTGSALESPSLYAILTGEKISASEIKNYSSDRVATIYENRKGISELGEYTVSRTLSETTAIGTARVSRCAEQDEAKCVIQDESATPMENATPQYNIIEDRNNEKNYNNGNRDSAISYVNSVINDSLYDNSFDTISGINAGEMLVEGAVNVGYALAKASGMSDGTDDAVNKYLALTSDVLAMDAAADRLNRSPLDITSKNTFLGSIVYKLAVSSIKSGSLLNKVASISRVTANAVKNILPSANADDGNEELYLAIHGECETKGYIEAVGTGTCASIGVSDTSTYEDAYALLDDKWMSENVTCNGNICTPKEGSSLMRYIEYNEMSNTPSGITDGEVIKKMSDTNYNTNTASSGCSGVVGWFKCKWNSLKSTLASIKEKMGGLLNLIGINKAIKNPEYEVPPEATKEAFVVGGDMWEEYKLAQRYIGLARAAETMRQYDGDETAYNFTGFGLGNPIARYIEEHSEDRLAANE